MLVERQSNRQIKSLNLMEVIEVMVKAKKKNKTINMWDENQKHEPPHTHMGVAQEEINK